MSDPSDPATPHPTPPAATGRRAAAKARTRQKVLDGALSVFAERGYGEASMEEIARAAGVAIGSVYAHFQNKRDLFEALLDAHLTADLQEAEQALGEGLTAALPGFDRKVAEAADSRHLALLDAESWLYAVRNGPHAGDALARRDDRTRRTATRIIAEHRRSRRAGPALSDEETATVIVSLFHGLVRQRRLVPGSVPDDLFSRVLVLLTGPAGDAPAGAGG